MEPDETPTKSGVDRQIFTTETRHDIVSETDKLTMAFNVCQVDRRAWDDPEVRMAAEKRILNALK